MILAHDTAGEPGATSVMMIHPLGADRTFYDACRVLLGPGLLTISCDLRGSGDSPALDAPLTLEQSAEDIEALRAHLGLTSMIVLGCAVGAMAGAVYASRHPERTRALVMANPGIRITGAGAEGLYRRAELVRADGMAAIPDAIENAFVGYGGTELRHRYEARFFAQDPQDYALAALGAAGSDIGGALGDIACPVLLVSGGNDRLFGDAHAREVAERVAHAETVALADAAHFIPYQEPAAFGAAVSAFVDRHDLR